MTQENIKRITTLAEHGWEVSDNTLHSKIPASVLNRYSWVSRDIIGALSYFSVVANPSDTAWLLTASDYCGEADSEFHWNQWEIDSLDASEQDEVWRRKIIEFWDDHFPIMLSVKSGYAYFAIRREDRLIVCGEEPEYEETTEIAFTFDNFIDDLVRPSRSIQKWV